MDISSIGSLSTALAQSQTADAINTLVLKKAMDQEASSAQQLIEALPNISSNPAHLGNSVDVRA